MINIAIIGAGLSGLTAANKLRNYATINVFEKSRGVGGRMSTRRAAPYFFDHGAQFFKVRTSAFKRFIDPMIKQGIIKRWDARAVEFKYRKSAQHPLWSAHHPHYVGVSGMNSVAKYLSQGLNVQCGVRVQSIKKDQGKWLLKDDQDNSLGTYDWVISAVPPEQAANLLPSSSPFSANVSVAKMNSCFALMLGFERSLSLDFEVALVHGEDIRWISVNNSKPGRNDEFCLVVHSTNAWADENIDNDRDQLMNYLCNQTSDVIGCDLNGANHKVIHAWRFANIGKQMGATHLVDPQQNIAVCGDWFIQGNVEAAFTSGFNMADNILKSITAGSKKPNA